MEELDKRADPDTDMGMGMGMGMDTAPKWGPGAVGEGISSQRKRR